MAVSDHEKLFRVPAGTYIDRAPDGSMLFCEPGKTPYTITVTAEIGSGRHIVEKWPIDPEGYDVRL